MEAVVTAHQGNDETEHGGFDQTGNNVDSLQKMLAEGQQQSVDMIFVDADKESYLDYLELGLQLLRPNGLLLFDNVLWNGYVADNEHRSVPGCQSAS